MSKKALEKTALLRNSDGSIYHLHLSPGELANTIILVGDPDRVSKVSDHFDKVEIKKRKREFVTHTGVLNNKPISVVSTGIGTDNIDIVINECDALHNVDFKRECVKDKITSIRFLRLGTCGGINKEVPVDSLVLSNFAVGFDTLMSFYQYENTPEEIELLTTLRAHFSELPAFQSAYIAKNNPTFSQRFEKQCLSGITLTAPGFYGPQYRTLRSPLIAQNILAMSNDFRGKQGHITNIEMETAGIYAISRLLGHEACSISLVIDNPITGEVSEDIEGSIDQMISTMLSLL